MHVHWHLKEVVMHLAALARHQPFDRLILAGSDDATDELRALLPRALAQRVVAVIGAEITASPSEILDKTLEVERKVEREVETRILEDLLENAGPNGRAIYGLEPTLDALYLNEVRTLVVADGVHVAGSECPVCARLEKGHVVTCPKCGAAMRDTHDVVHRAMLRVAELAGRVEVVHEAAARRLEVEGGGFGALLRYRSQVA
jgi:peptide subunit release factor 1 (eRF1)